MLLKSNMRFSEREPELIFYFRYRVDTTGFYISGNGLWCDPVGQQGERRHEKENEEMGYLLARVPCSPLACTFRSFNLLTVRQLLRFGLMRDSYLLWREGFPNSLGTMVTSMVCHLFITELMPSQGLYFLEVQNALDSPKLFRVCFTNPRGVLT